jgi:hypothetical protein
MSTHGFGNGVELVKIMIKGDLKTSWVMFDHFKRVHDWTTCVWSFLLSFIDRYFVWNESKRPWVLELVLDMLEWTSDVSGLPKTNFHGFMANVTIMNYNVICKVYGGDPNVPLEGKKHTCFYHWEESLWIHTKKLMFLTFQDHITSRNIVACDCHLQLNWL